MSKTIILFLIAINCQAQMVVKLDREIPEPQQIHPCLLQEITVGADDELLWDVLDRIKDESKKKCVVPVCYAITSMPKVKFDAQPRTLIETVILALQDTGLSFKIMGEHQIVVYEKSVN